MLISLMCFAVGMTVPLSGTVVDAEGHPVAGATVWLGDTFGPRRGPEVLAATTTDDRGRFRLDRADDLAGRGPQWSPTLWAYKPGSRVGFLEFKKALPKADEPVRITLGPPASTALRVLQPGGKPAQVTRVRLVATNLKAPRPPDTMLDGLAVTTDADGRATLDGFAPADIFALRVTAPGQPLQSLPIDPDTGIVRLRPLGRLEVRLAGDEPKALGGWTITAASRPIEPGYRGPYTTHLIRRVTDDRGRAEYPHIAEGQVIWTIKAPEGSNDLVVKEPSATIRAGETTKVEIAVRRGVRVEGTVREEDGGAPVAGIKVDVAPSQMGSRMVHYIVTDARGRFSKVVPPGRINLSYSDSDMPKAYYEMPGTQTWISFDVDAGEERHECNPPPLRKGGLVRGKVVDEAGRPVAGADVEGTLRSGVYASYPQHGPGRDRRPRRIHPGPHRAEVRGEGHGEVANGRRRGRGDRPAGRRGRADHDPPPQTADPGPLRPGARRRRPPAGRRRR